MGFQRKLLGDLGMIEMIEMILKVEMSKVSWKSISDSMQGTLLYTPIPSYSKT